MHKAGASNIFPPPDGFAPPDARPASGWRLMPVTHSIIAPGALLQQIAGSYLIGEVRSCQLLCSGSSDTYLVEASDGHYIARIYRTGWRSLSDIEYELALLLHLRECGICVPHPIVDGRNALTQAVLAPEGTRYLALFDYLEGSPLLFDNADSAQLAGQAAVRIHAAADRFARPCTRPSLNLVNLIDKPPDLIRSFLGSRPDARNYIENLAQRLRERAGRFITSDLDWGLCHGDFGRKNLLQTSDGQLVVLDFDNCAMGWRAYDFTSIYGEARGRGRMDLYDAFVDGYKQQRPISEADLAAVPLFRGLRHLYMLGVFAQNASAWGVAAIRGQGLDGWLQYLRQWEADHLEPLV